MDKHNDDKGTTKRYFDAIMIVPLEEEFTVALGYFNIDDDLTSSKQIRFAISIPNVPAEFLIVKQNQMGRTSNQEAVSESLGSFDTGLLLCVGIAGGLSSDVAIGDVCYTGQLIDVLDNTKISDTRKRKAVLTLSPTTYDSPPAVTIPISVDRISPATKTDHMAWVSRQEEFATSLIPSEFSGRNGRKEKIKGPNVHEGKIVCGPVSASPEFNRIIKALDRKVLAIETESG